MDTEDGRHSDYYVTLKYMMEINSIYILTALILDVF